MSADAHTPLCLFGAGGHGKVVASLVKKQWNGKLCFADAHQVIGTQISGVPVQFQDVSHITGHDVIVTIGSNLIRETVQNKAEKQKLNIVSFVADQAVYMPDLAPGLGTMILAGAVVNIDVQIGRGVILNTCAVVEHDCHIGDFCHLAPGAVALGASYLGARVWLGANATVLQGIHVVADCVIGAGAVVTQNIVEPGVYVGAPARLLSS